jgi:hypothetical protein
MDATSFPFSLWEKPGMTARWKQFANVVVTIAQVWPTCGMKLELGNGPTLKELGPWLKDEALRHERFLNVTDVTASSKDFLHCKRKPGDGFSPSSRLLPSVRERLLNDRERSGYLRDARRRVRRVGLGSASRAQAGNLRGAQTLPPLRKIRPRAGDAPPHPLDGWGLFCVAQEPVRIIASTCDVAQTSENSYVTLSLHHTP